MWARIDNGLCAEVTSTDPEGRFHPEVVWVPVPEHLARWVNPAYVLEGGALAPPSMDYLLHQLYEAVAARRWRAEVGGSALADGTPVPTDDRTKLLVNGSYRKAEKEPDRVFRWETTRGVFVDVPAPLVIAMGDAIFDHVQACFSRAGEICAALKAQADAAPADFAAVADVLDAEIDRVRDGDQPGWPSVSAE